jgi:hypothetical protein
MRGNAGTRITFPIGLSDSSAYGFFRLIRFQFHDDAGELIEHLASEVRQRANESEITRNQDYRSINVLASRLERCDSRHKFSLRVFHHFGTH